MSALSRFAPSTLVDWALGGVGVSLAAASASFATYMIATAPAQVADTGSRDFTVFVRWDRRAPGTMTHGPSQTPRTEPSPPLTAQATPPNTPAIDPTPVGSIPTDPDGSKVQPRSNEPAGRATGPLREFRIRDVFGDHALIEHRSDLSLVKPGSILAGAGEVLAIERQGNGWIVRTAHGIIGGS